MVKLRHYKKLMIAIIQECKEFSEHFSESFTINGPETRSPPSLPGITNIIDIVS